MDTGNSVVSPTHSTVKDDDMPSQTEIRKQITQEIIESLQQGIVPWMRPWSADKNCGRPTNAVTKNRYNGINILLLGLHNQAYPGFPIWVEPATDPDSQPSRL